ncbi:uncharacterized protein BCR38DRAFT_440573 [Pseudomassariella vexata]|uniref:Uncharacterized protein n=1 Tax=Pseudomassariella vexata TaxID=1141098 RepID=A0A1Y2DR39_9PEZI|nr:uncharacterized protein BCR38DRAFT_440573 [Pseudomassariella vexata]ORY61576.1 hypothetical protein BCR38DRAFT_440573 [Pseudomassariella vexata]
MGANQLYSDLPATDGALITAAEADFLEKYHGLIGPKLLRFREKKRRIRQEYCTQRDRLQRQHADELFGLYRDLRMECFESHRLQYLRWRTDLWNVWGQYCYNFHIVSMVIFIALMAWAHDFWVERIKGYWLRQRQRLQSRDLYELHDGELWDLTIMYAAEYGWDAIEDNTGFFLRPDTTNFDPSANEWW